MSEGNPANDKQLEKHSHISIEETRRVVPVRISTEGVKWASLPPNIIRIGRDLARINLEDGTVMLGEGVPLDDAAQEFWEAIHRVYGEKLVKYHYQASLMVDKRVKNLEKRNEELCDRLYEIQTIAEGNTND